MPHFMFTKLQYSTAPAHGLSCLRRLESSPFAPFLAAGLLAFALPRPRPPLPTCSLPLDSLPLSELLLDDSELELSLLEDLRRDQANSNGMLRFMSQSLSYHCLRTAETRRQEAGVCRGPEGEQQMGDGSELSPLEDLQ